MELEDNEPLIVNPRPTNGMQRLSATWQEDEDRSMENRDDTASYSSTSDADDDHQQFTEQPVSLTRSYVTVVILFCINLLNYIDRYTLAANLPLIQTYFNLGEDNLNSNSGLLQTVFIGGYMLTSPIFGYLGDRYSRKAILVFGIFVWSMTTLAGSFVPADKFILFLVLRAVVGVGEASYSTVASTIIADLFTGNKRTQMLMIFYFAIPFGSGLGYIAGSAIAKAFDDNWKRAFQFTPAFGLISCFLIIFIIKEPKRGQAESGNKNFRNTSYLDDVKALLKNPSWIWSSLGFTSVAWVVGALSLWAPNTIKYAYQIQGKDPNQVDFIFGTITCIAGLFGVFFGTIGAQWYRKFNPRADPLVCALGLLSGAPFLFLGLMLAPVLDSAAWVLILIAEILLFLNWALVPDILLSVILPARRSTGSALQILIGHALGDAFSPWIIGAISDKIRRSMSLDSPYDDFYALQYALYISTFITVLGGGAFLVNALYIEQDKARIVRLVTGDVDNATRRATNGGLILPIDAPAVEDNYESESD